MEIKPVLPEQQTQSRQLPFWSLLWFNGGYFKILSFSFPFFVQEVFLNLIYAKHCTWKYTYIFFFNAELYFDDFAQHKWHKIL